MSASGFKPTREIEPSFMQGSKIWINREDNLPTDPNAFQDFKSGFDLARMTNEKRIRELFHGRYVAKRLIENITGKDPGWLPIGENGKPVLPSQVLASFSHSGHWIAVWANLKTPHVRSIGIDLQTWITEKEAKLLEEGFRRRSFNIPPPLLAFPLHERITIVFSILESIQKILGNANEAFIAISKMNLDVNPETKKWASLSHDSLKIEGTYEPNREFVLAYGLSSSLHSLSPS